MAADVSSLLKVMNGYKDDRTVRNEGASGKSTALMTMDLLDGVAGFTKIHDQSQELDLDLQVPNGWEKCLDLKSGKVYLQRYNPSSSSSLDHRHQTNQTGLPKLQELNSPPSPLKLTLNLFDDGNNLELKLLPTSPLPSSSTSTSTSTNYQSVCTLDKVKSALERAETDQPIRIKRSAPLHKSSLPPKLCSLSNIMESTHEDEKEGKLVPSSPVAAACPGCLSYVLIMRNNPKCPRCDSFVPTLPAVKKPRIDLNISI